MWMTYGQEEQKVDHSNRCCNGRNDIMVCLNAAQHWNETVMAKSLRVIKPQQVNSECRQGN